MNQQIIKDLEEINEEQNKLESHKLANLCYLVELCTKEGFGKSSDITVTEYEILDSWCELSDLNSGDYKSLLSKVVKHYQNRVDYYKNLRLIREELDLEGFNQTACLVGEENEEEVEIIGTENINLIIKNKDNLINLLKEVNEYESNVNRIDLDRALEYVLERHRYDCVDLAVKLTHKQIGQLFDIANSNFRIDPEERDILGHIILMNQEKLTESIEDARNEANTFLVKHTNNRSILIGLSKNDKFLFDIKDILESAGYKIGFLFPTLKPSDFYEEEVALGMLTGSPISSDKLLEDKHKLAVDYKIEHDYESKFIPNMIIIDPKTYIDEVIKLEKDNFREKSVDKYIDFIEGEIRGLCEGVKAKEKQIPILIYGEKKYVDPFKDMSLNISILERETSDVLNIESKDVNEESEIEKLYSQINQIYSVLEDTKAI